MAVVVEVNAVEDEVVAVVGLVLPASCVINMVMMPSIAGTALIKVLFLLHRVLRLVLLILSPNIFIKLRHHTLNLPILLHIWQHRNFSFSLSFSLSFQPWLLLPHSLSRKPFSSAPPPLLPPTAPSPPPSAPPSTAAAPSPCEPPPESKPSRRPPLTLLSLKNR